MKKAVRIGSIDFDYKLWVTQEYAAIKNVASARRTVAGTTVVYEQANRNTSLLITLDSKNSGWQKESTVEAIIELADGLLGKSTTLEYDDGTMDSVRFAYETRGGAVQASALYEGADWYKIKIYLGRS